MTPAARATLRAARRAVLADIAAALPSDQLVSAALDLVVLAREELAGESALVKCLDEQIDAAVKDAARQLNRIAGAAGVGDGSGDEVADRIIAAIEKLRARVAELEARPVMTAQALCDALVNARDRGKNLFVPAGVAEDVANQIAALGPVTLPTPDRAEELIAAYVDEYADTEERDGNPPPRKWREVEQERRDWSIGVMRRALAKLATPAAPAVEAAPAAEPKPPRYKVVKADDVPPATAALWRFTRTAASRAADDLNAGRGLSWELRCPHARSGRIRTHYAVIDTRPEEG